MWPFALSHTHLIKHTDLRFGVTRVRQECIYVDIVRLYIRVPSHVNIVHVVVPWVGGCGWVSTGGSVACLPVGSCATSTITSIFGAATGISSTHHEVTPGLISSTTYSESKRPKSSPKSISVIT